MMIYDAICEARQNMAGVRFQAAILLVGFTLAFLPGMRAVADENDDAAARATQQYREARADDDRNDFAAAERKYLALLEILPGIYGKASPAEVAVRLNLARIYLSSNELNKAQAQFVATDRLLSAIHGRDAPERSRALSGIANVLRLRGDVQSAKQILEACVALCEDKHDFGERTFVPAANSLAHVYAAEGRFDKAIRFYGRCLEIHAKLKGDSHPGTLQIAKNLGAALHGAGHYTDAHRILFRVLSEQRNQGQAAALDFASTCLSAGELCLTLASYDAAEKLFAESLAIYEQSFPNGTPESVSALTGLARLYQYQRQYEKAETACARIDSLLKKMRRRESFDGLAFLAVLGTLRLSQNKYRESEDCCREALNLCISIKAPLFHRITAEHNLAYNLLQQGRFGEALHYQELATRGWESYLGQSHPYHIIGLGTLARIHEASGKLVEARAAYNSARHGSHTHAASVLPSLPAWSQIDYLMVQDFVHWHRALNFSIRNPNDADLAMMAWEWVMNFKGLATRVRLQSQVISRAKASKEADAVAVTERQLARAQLSRLETVENSTDRDRVEQEIAALEKKRVLLSQKLRYFITSESPPSAWISGSEVVKEMGERQAFIDFVRLESFKPEQEAGEGTIYAAFVTHRGQTRVVALGEAGRIDPLTQRVRRLLGDGIQRVEAIGLRDAEMEARSGLAELANLVLAPIRPLVGDADEWILSPDGELWAVPWCGLPIENGGYLVEQVVIRTAMSAVDLIPDKRSASPEELSSPVIFANPDFNAKSTDMAPLERSLPAELRLGDVRNLPGTAGDAKAAQDLFTALYAQAPTMLTGEKATLAEFLAIHRPQAIAIATHGFYVPAITTKELVPPFQPGQLSGLAGTTEPLLRCGLLASGCNVDGPARAHGVVTGLDVLSLDLRGCQLVLLNTCESGIGDPIAGDGLTGLRQAFLVAGAKAIVANLWNIPDRETAKLTAKLAQRLQRGDPVERALALAQREMISSDRNRNGATHPQFWGAHLVTRSH
jgi:tetratricopeptide (TPR) repeat protein